MALRGRDGVGVADVLPGRTVHRLDPVFGRVLLAQRQGIDAELTRQLVEAAFDAPGRIRRAGRAVGRDLRPVADHVVAGDLGVRQVVHGKGAHAAGPHRRARKGPRLIFERDFAGGQPPVPLGAEPDLDDRTRRRPGGAEHFLAAHHHLDRPPGLLGQGQGHGFQIDERLAAEAAADLGRNRPDVRDVDGQKLGAIGADHERTLARTPDRALAVGGRRHDAGMRLDIGLMHRLVRIAPLDDDVGVAEPGLDVALGKGDLLGDVRGLRRHRIDTPGVEVVVQQGRLGPHRRFDIDDVRQHVVVDLDQLACRFGDRGRGRGDRRHRMALVKHLVARHAVARQVAEIHRPFADERLLGRDRRKVLPGHHPFDARQFERLARCRST